jgi:hypothetical protein
MGWLSLMATLGLNITPFERGLRTAQDGVKDFGRNALRDVKGQLAAAFGVGALIAFGKESIALAGHIKDIQETTSLTTDEVQELGKAAQNVGQDIEFVRSSLIHFADARKKAAESDLALRDMFGRYGVSGDALKSSARDLELIKSLTNSVRGDMSRGDMDAFKEFFGGKRAERMVAIMREYDRVQGNIAIFSKDEVERLDQISKKWDEILRKTKLYFGKEIDKATQMPFSEGAGGKPKSFKEKFYEVFGFNFPFSVPHAGGSFAAHIGDEIQGPSLPGNRPTVTPAQLDMLQGILGNPLPGARARLSRATGRSKSFDTTRTLEDSMRGEIEDIRDKINETMADMMFRKMNPLEQQRYLEKRAKEHEDIAGAIAEKGFEGVNGGDTRSETDRLLDEKNRQEHLASAQGYRSQLQDLLMSQKNTTTFDSMARVGGFNSFSGMGNQALSVQQQQLSTLRTIATNTAGKQSPHGEGTL